MKNAFWRPAGSPEAMGAMSMSSNFRLVTLAFSQIRLISAFIVHEAASLSSATPRPSTAFPR